MVNQVKCQGLDISDQKNTKNTVQNSLFFYANFAIWANIFAPMLKYIIE